MASMAAVICSGASSNARAISSIDEIARALELAPEQITAAMDAITRRV